MLLNIIESVGDGGRFKTSLLTAVENLKRFNWAAKKGSRLMFGGYNDVINLFLPRLKEGCTSIKRECTPIITLYLNLLIEVDALTSTSLR